jgi:hypothetical protein
LAGHGTGTAARENRRMLAVDRLQRLQRRREIRRAVRQIAIA